METQPHKGHEWLQKLLGEWTYTTQAAAAEGGPQEILRGTESVRSLGGMWVIAEGRGEMPGGGIGLSMITLGYNPQTGRYVGTWIGSMMSHLWLCDGVLDASRNALTLNSEGPDMSEPATKTAKYRDVIEFKSDDHRVLTGQMLRDDGTWQTFMTVDYRRA